MTRCLATLEHLDDAHAAAAAGAWRGQRIFILNGMIVRRAIGVGRDVGCRHTQKLARRRDALGLGAASEESVVADAMEALRENVNEEAADELTRIERHGGVTSRPLDAVILDFE